MKFWRTKKFKVFLSIILLYCLGYFGGTWYATQKIEILLQNKLPKQIQISYEDLSLSPIRGALTLKDLTVEIQDSTLEKTESKFHFNTLEMGGISYLRLYNDQALEVSKMVLKNPSGSFRQTSILVPSDTVSKEDSFKIKTVSIGNFEIDKGHFEMYESASDSLKMKVQNVSVRLEKLKIKLDTVSEQKFQLGNYEIDLDSLFFKIGTYDNLQIGAIKGNTKCTLVNHIKLKTHPDAKALSRLISIERDHYNLKIDTINVHDISLYETESPYDFRSSRIDFKNLEFSVYRDKLIGDDRSIKPMTSEMLRKISIPFMVDSVSFGHNKISYQERVKPYNDGGILFFDEGHLAIRNLSNYPPENTQTTLYIDTKFMGRSPVKATWIFSANDRNDQFRFRGSSTGVQLSDINAFSAPNLNATMKGEIYSLYYDFYGDAYQSEATVKANFNDVEIAVLDKNNSKRNKFYSSLANLVVKNSSKTKKSIYQEAQVPVTRDRTKSQFNFIYLNLKESLMKVFL